MSTEPLLTFSTLASVGYTACGHPRVDVNVAGELHRALTICRDCGAQDGKGGSLHFQRLPWTI